MTQEELAARAGLHVQEISKLERGVLRNPRSTTVEFLAEALKLDAQQKERFIVAARVGSARPAPTPLVGPRAELAVPRRVFVSHTTDLGKPNEPGTFVAAAVRAVLRAGHAVADMAYFAARDAAPAALCMEMVARSDIYVGIVGARYGSCVRDRPDVSYTELEFETAAQRGQVRLIFLIREDSVHLPAADELAEFRARQDAFRRRLLDSGATVVQIGSPGELELAVFHALVELGNSTARPQERRGRPDRSIGAYALNQLPPDVEDFTGRHREMAALQEMLIHPGQSAIVVSAVSGRGGVGKTTLAVHVAHHLAGHFTEGCLYANLRGATARPRDPAEILVSLLSALGVDGRRVPEGLDARGELYRSHLAGRRVLVVLDDAADERQVRPLLPGTPTCAALVTSRAPLVALEGARQIELDMLTMQEAVELLGRVAGARRLGAEPAAALQIAGLCDRLPLAVRIAGARLAARPHWRPSHLVERLLDERRRLDELVQGDLEVRASIALSYSGLSAIEQRAFRRLGLLAAPEFPAWIAAALLDLSLAEADDVLESLAEARLLEVSGAGPEGQPRFRCHDLVRLYARERVIAEDAYEQREGALERVLHGWCQLATEAKRRLTGRPAGTGGRLEGAWELDRASVEEVLVDPIAWFEADRLSLASAVVQACGADITDLACRLAVSLATCFSMRGYFDDWRRLHDLALDAARRAADRRAEAVLESGLGDLHFAQDRYDEALACFQRARPTFREVGDRHREAAVLRSMGFTLRLQGRYDDAVVCFQQTLDLVSELDAAHDRVNALLGIGIVRVDQGRYDEALTPLHVARVEAESLGYRHGEARVFRTLGRMHQEQHRYDEARAMLERARQIWRERGDQPSETHAAYGLGEIDRLCGRLTEASATLHHCLARYRAYGDLFNEALTLRSLGKLHRAAGQLEFSIEYLRESLRMFVQLRLPLWEARALHGLADVLATAGDEREAAETQRQIQALVNEHGLTEALVAYP